MGRVECDPNPNQPRTDPRKGSSSILDFCNSSGHRRKHLVRQCQSLWWLALCGRYNTRKKSSAISPETVDLCLFSEYELCKSSKSTCQDQEEKTNSILPSLTTTGIKDERAFLLSLNKNNLRHLLFCLYSQKPKHKNLRFLYFVQRQDRAGSYKYQPENPLQLHRSEYSDSLELQDPRCLDLHLRSRANAKSQGKFKTLILIVIN